MSKLMRKGGDNLKKALMFVLIVALFVMACSSGNSWKIVSKLDADEYPVYTLRSPSGQTMIGTPAGGTKKVPPVGATCTLKDNLFDCGKKFQKLNAYYPPPV